MANSLLTKYVLAATNIITNSTEKTNFIADGIDVSEIATSRVINTIARETSAVSKLIADWMSNKNSGTYDIADLTETNLSTALNTHVAITFLERNITGTTPKIYSHTGASQSQTDVLTTWPGSAPGDDTSVASVKSMWTIIDKLSGATKTEISYLSGVSGALQSQINNLSSGKESTITAGTTGQYWRGDKVWTTFPTIGTATLTIQKNSATIDTFNANATVNKTINITVPTVPSDIGAQVAGSYLTGNQTITLSGDITGSGATSISTTLASVGRSDTSSIVSVGYSGIFTTVDSITTDAKGRITAANIKTIQLPDAPTPYTLPIATSLRLGGVKIGAGVNVTEEGIISVTTTSISAEPTITAATPDPTTKYWRGDKSWQTFPTIGNATLTVQKNSATIDTFTANATGDKTINITVPTQATDISAVPVISTGGSAVAGIWIGTAAQYTAVSKSSNVLYFVTS